MALFDDDLVEIVVIPAILYSDGTLLANFGDAKLWPGYATNGLLTEYIRLVPKSFAIQHFCYLPEVLFLI